MKQSETNTDPFERAFHDTQQRSLVSSVLGRPITVAEAETLTTNTDFVRWLEGLAQRKHGSATEDSN